MNRKKNIIIGIMCVSILFMGIVFALFETKLTINGTSTLLGEWDIAITNISSTITGTAQNITAPTFTGINATLNFGFYKPGDKIEYAITVSNNGNINAIISDVIINTSGSSDIIYTVQDLQKNTTLSKNTSTTFKLVTEFDRDATVIPAITEKTINIVLVVMQSDGTNPTPVAPDITDTSTQYGIMYVANGGSGSMKGTVCTVGQSCTLKTNTFTRNEYNFMGWSTTPTGEVEYTDGDSVTDLTTKGKTQVLYAVWGDLATVILSDNIPQSDVNIDFSKTSGKGLYYTSTNTEDNKTTYYFRGDVQNNYVQFGTHNSDIYYGYYSATSEAFNIYDSLSACQSATSYNVNCTKAFSAGDPILWRIVRINEDGSIRLTTQYFVGHSVFNIYSYDNAYIGYMYGTAGSATYAETHANTHDSTIKEFIDAWYEENLISYSNYLADAGFCNDRSVAPSAGLWWSGDTALGYRDKTTIYGAGGRLLDGSIAGTVYGDWDTKENAQPQFKCPNEENDLFTTNLSSKGNKALKYPIGLITVDEVAYAGATYGSFSINNYLRAGNDYWTMTPFTDHLEFEVSYSGSSSAFTVWHHSDNGIRPVINLKPTFELSTNLPSGCTELDGTQACPYIIDTSV